MSITCTKQQTKDKVCREFGEMLRHELGCNAYDLLDADQPTTFWAKVMDRVIQVDTLGCFIYRPMQLREHINVGQ